jgi:hypothetical protein
MKMFESNFQRCTVVLLSYRNWISYFRGIIFPAVITLVMIKIYFDLIIVHSKFIIFG